jgi:hypothetical protein
MFMSEPGRLLCRDAVGHSGNSQQPSQGRTPAVPRQSASLDRLEECPAIPQPFDPIFPATTLGELLFSFLAGISKVLRVGEHEDQICMWRHKVLQSVAIVSPS